MDGRDVEVEACRGAAAPNSPRTPFFSPEKLNMELEAGLRHLDNLAKQSKVFEALSPSRADQGPFWNLALKDFD